MFHRVINEDILTPKLKQFLSNFFQTLLFIPIDLPANHDAILISVPYDRKSKPVTLHRAQETWSS